MLDIVSKQFNNTIAIWHFFDKQEGSATSNKSNWATYAANKEWDESTGLEIFFLCSLQTGIQISYSFSSSS